MMFVGGNVQRGCFCRKMSRVSSRRRNMLWESFTELASACLLPLVHADQCCQTSQATVPSRRCFECLTRHVVLTRLQPPLQGTSCQLRAAGAPRVLGWHLRKGKDVYRAKVLFSERRLVDTKQGNHFPGLHCCAA